MGCNKFTRDEPKNTQRQYSLAMESNSKQEGGPSRLILTSLNLVSASTVIVTFPSIRSPVIYLGLGLPKSINILGDEHLFHNGQLRDVGDMF